MNSGITFKNSVCALLVLFSSMVTAQDVAINITTAPTSFTPGTSQSNAYVFTVGKSMAGAGDVTNLGVTATFNILSDLTGITWTCSVPMGSTAICNNASGTGVINTSVDLIGDDEVTFTFTNVTVLSDVFSNMNLNVAIASMGDGDNSNNTDSQSITRDSLTDLNISVDDNATSYTPGISGVNYAIQVVNAGPSDAMNIDFSHVLPTGMTVSNFTCTPQTGASSCTSPANLTNVALNIAAGETTNIVATADYSSSVRSNPLVYSVSALITDTNATDPNGATPAAASDSDALNLVSNLSIVVDTAIIADSNYTPGNGQTYTVTVSNSGDSDVLAATVVDNNLSEFANINWTCVAAGGSSCTATGPANTRLNTTADIVAGSSVTYTVVVTYASSATTDPLIYTVTASNPSGSPTVSGTSPVSNSKSLMYDPESNLTLTLDDNQATYTPGLNGVFTATVTNVGPSDVSGVTIIDNDIADFDSVSWTCSVVDVNSSCVNGATALNTTANIAAGDSATYVVTGVFDSATVTNPLVYTVTATNPMGVRGTSPATDTDNDDVLDRKVDLTITKTGKTGTLVPNEPFTYSILISNAGPSDLGAGFTVQNISGVDVIVPTEDGVNLVDNIDTLLIDHPTKCNVNLQPGDPVVTTPCWEYCSSDRGTTSGVDGDVSPDNCPATAEVKSGTGQLLDIPIRIASGNSSEVRIYTRLSSGAGSDCDAATAADNEVCNTASISIVETATTTNVGMNPLIDDVSNEIVIGTDLVVTKTDNKTTASPGTANSYSIVVRNDGFIDVEGITVSDIMPLYPANSAGYVSGSVSWVCETNDANACCNTQSTACGLNSPTSLETNDVLDATIDLGAQTEVTFTLNGDIDAQSTGTISNSVTATLPTGVVETDASNNTNIIDTTSLGESSDIVLVKTLEPVVQDTVDDTIYHLRYKIVVSNLGPSLASSVNVIDQLDDTKIDAASRSWTCAASAGATCTTSGPVTNSPINSQVSLGVNSSVTFTVDLSSNSNAQGKIVNVASATTTGFDPVSANNTDSVEYSLTGSSQLTISNDDARISATPGLSTSYMVKVTNQGPDDVFGATVKDVFPPQLSDVEWSCTAQSPIPGDLTAFRVSDQSATGSHMIISPDDSHVYITSPDAAGVDSRLYVFKRNTLVGSNFGEISFIEFKTQGMDSVDGIEAPVAMAMSASGQFLYVLSDVAMGSMGVPAIAIFARDSNPVSSNFGKLTFQGLVTTNIPSNPVDILLTDDQKHVYVSGDGNIQAYEVDAGTGQLSHVQTKAQADAGVMTQASNGSDIYVVDASGNNVNAYSRNSTSGILTDINSINNTDINNVSDVVISADGMHVYLAATGSSKLVMLNRNISSGDISFGMAYDDMSLLFNATETLVGLNSIAISPDGEHVYVGNQAESAILVLNRNSQGILSKKEKIGVTEVPGLDGVSDVAATADGRHVMGTASGTTGKTLSELNRRQPDPIFAFVEAEFDGVDDSRDAGGTVDGLLGASAVIVSDDGKHVYVAGLGDNSIAVFARDKTKGQTNVTKGEHLNFIASYNDSDSGISGLLDVDSMVLTSNGSYLYVGSSDQATLAVFSRAADGTLAFVSSYSHVTNNIDGLLGISAMVVDSSNQNLYVAGRFEASVVHYAIQSDGTLVLMDSVANGDAGVSGLDGARSLAISPDGEHIVVASSIDDRVVVLSRSLVNGEITFMQSVASVGDQPMDLAISDDGEHVYVVSANDSRLTVLKRVNNPSSSNFGRLSIITSYSDGVAGFDYLLGARTVAVSPDGSKVYVGAEFDSALTILDRDQNSNSSVFGQLTVVEVKIDNSDGVDGLNQLYDLVVSNDAKNVYVAGFSDNALASFVLGSGSFCGAKGSGNINDIVDIGVNGVLTYTIDAKIVPQAVGTVVTEASVLPPDNFTPISPADNCSTAALFADDNCDRDSTNLIPVTDLSITKTDNRISVVAGEPVTYEIVVSNNGPSNAKTTSLEAITVSDVLNSGFDASSADWSCEAIGSGSLAFIQSLSNGNNGNVGLQGVSSLTVATDLATLGPHVLATSVLENGLLAYSMDPVTGNLTQVLQSGDFIKAGSGIDLTGARDLLVIDDDIYVVSQVDDALVEFKASNSGGVLDIAWMANHNFASGAFGLNQAVAIVASTDGQYIYVAGANDDSVAIFSRDLMTGVLTYDSTITQGDVNGSMGLSGVNALAISSDNYSLYSSGVNNGSIGVYKRNLADGSLSFVEVLDSSSTGIALTGISSIEVSIDGKQVYVTSALNNSLYVFNRKNDVPVTDSTYGSLSLQQQIYHNVGTVTGLLSPSDVVGSTDGRHVYVTGEQSDSVAWFARNLVTGDLTFGGFVNDFSANIDGLNGAVSVALDATGKYVYVAGSQDDAIAVLSRLDDSFCLAGGTGNIQTDVDIAVNGSLIFQLNATVASGATGNLINTARVDSCFTSVPLGVGCSGSDPIDGNNSATDTDSINPVADLMISKTDGLSQYDGLNGVVKVTGNNKNLYVAAKGENAIGIFVRVDNSGDADYGNLGFIGNVKNGVDGVSGLLSVADVLLSADGKTLYAAGAGDNSIVVFSRNLSDGSLTFLERHSSGVFGVVGIEGVKSLAISDDGAHLYATGPLTNSMAVFSIDQTNGRLTFIQNLQDSVAGVSGLISASDVAVSIDGKHVYVTSNTANSVSVFLRNPNSASIGFGQLSYIATYTNGNNGVAGIAGATALTLSKANDGDFVYVLGAADQSVAVFSRDTGTGELSFIEFKQNGTSNVEGLNIAQDLAISADGLSLYVAGFDENALVQFDRDAINGTLTFVNALNDGDALAQPGEFIDGLSGASGLFVTDDDGHVYVAAAGDNALSGFNRDATGDIAFQQVLIDGQGGVSPGTDVTYTIVVSNAGPSNVQKATISDVFPPEFEEISYECFPLAGAMCAAGVQIGNVDIVADLPVGSSVEIKATGRIKSDVTGVLVNTASVASSTNPSFAITDPDMSNNTATDDDTLLSPAVDLMVTKENGLTEVIPGTPVTYSIVVSNDAMLPGNNEPADIQNVMITDVVPEAISNVTWSCQAFPQPGLLDDNDGNDMINSFVNYNDIDYHNDMLINQSGTHAYVSGTASGIGVILVYERNQRTGELLEVQRLQNGVNGVTGLSGAQGLALSSDQKNLYVASEIDDSIVTFSIDSLTAQLSFVSVLTDGLSGVNGIGGAKDVILSLDGNQVYVAGKLDNAIAIFNRNSLTGNLSYNTLLTGVEGLSGVESMVFDDTGNYLLVVAESNDSLASFKRDISTGLLTPVDVIQDFEIPDSVLQQPKDLLFKDNKIYVASFASDALSIFDMDNLGGLAFGYAIHQGDTNVGMLEGPENLVFSDTGNELYVASSVSGAITLFSLENQIVSPLNIVYDTMIIPGLDGVAQLLIDPIGDFFYALSDDLVLASILNGSSCGSQGVGNLDDVADISSGGHLIYTLQGDVQPAVTGTLSNTATALTGTGFVELFAPDNSATDSDVLTPISDLSVNKTDGLLEVVAGTPLSYDISAFSAGPSTVNASIVDTVPLFPTDNAGFFAGTIDWQCAENKTIQFNEETVDDGSNGLSGVSDVVLSSDGLFAYAISPIDSSVAIYSRNMSGELTFISVINNDDILPNGMVSGLSGAVSASFDASENYLYVAAQTANSIVVFSRDSNTGLLDYVQTLSSGSDGVVGLTGPVKLVMAPDNMAAYVAAPGSDAIVVLARDVNTGVLSFVERIKDGFGTIVPESNVIIGITDLLMSLDGKYLYTVANGSDAIAIFSRDTSSQVLTFVEAVRAGDIQAGVPVAGMDGVQSIAMSPGSKFLYAVASNDSSLLTFSRNLSDGKLVYQSVLQTGDAGSGQIVMPTSVTITPDGARLLISDADSDSVNLYERNIATGSVTLLDVFTNITHGSSLMVEPQSLLTDGTNILVVSPLSSALVALRITAYSDCLTDKTNPDVVTANLYMTPTSSGGVTVQALVHPSARGIINNTALISPTMGAGDNNLLNNSALDTTKITIETDVDIVKTGPTDVVAGESIEYTLVLNNTGPSDALDVQVLDVLDAAIINATWSCRATGRSFCNDDTGTGSLDTRVNVGIDGDIIIVIFGTVSPAFNGVLSNTASAVVIEEGFNTDTDLSNNSSTISTNVTMVADIDVTKSNNVATVAAGETVVYDIVVTNNGPSDAPDNLVTDLMPSLLTNVSWTCVTDAASSCTASGTGDINDVTYIIAGGQLSYQVTGILPSATEVGVLTNSVDVAVRQPATDPDLSNNSAIDTDPTEIIADVKIDLTSSINPYDPDGPVNLPFLLDISNDGPSDARNVIATFNIAANAIYQIPFKCVEQTSLMLVCDIGYMVAGANKKIAIDYRLVEATPTTITSTAEVTTTSPDPDLNNNINVLNTDLLTGIDIRVTKSNSSNIVRLGFATSYLIRIDNIGSIDAGDINIVETMPVELLNGTWSCSASNGATCLINNASSVTTASGNLPSGGVIEIVVDALVDPALPNVVFTEISNTVEASMVTTIGEQDYQLLNNTATDTDVLLRIIFIDGFEGNSP